MLTEKPWRGEALFRLGLSILLCIMIAGLLSSAVRFFAGPAKPKAILFTLACVAAFGCFIAAVFLLGRSWRSERYVRSFASLMICVYAGFVLAWAAESLTGGAAGDHPIRDRVLAGLGFQGATLFLIRRFVREHQLGWNEAFGFNIGWKRALIVGAVCGVIFIPVGIRLQEICALLMTRFKLEPEAQEAVQVLSSAQAWSSWLLLGIMAVVIAPIAEELLFRGILYPFIKRIGWPRTALWGTALLFGAIHGHPPSFLPLALLAVMLTWLYEKTNNLLAPITAHGVFNGLNFAMLYWSEHLSRLPRK